MSLHELYQKRKKLEIQVNLYHTRVNDPTLQHRYYKPHNEIKLEESTKELSHIRQEIEKNKTKLTLERMKHQIYKNENERSQLEHLYQEALVQLSE